MIIAFWHQVRYHFAESGIIEDISWQRVSYCFSLFQSDFLPNRIDTGYIFPSRGCFFFFLILYSFHFFFFWHRFVLSVSNDKNRTSQVWLQRVFSLLPFSAFSVEPLPFLRPSERFGEIEAEKGEPSQRKKKS